MDEAMKEVISIYSRAAHAGYPWRYGEGRIASNGRTWLSRFQKTSDPDDTQVLFIGLDPETGEYVEERA